jgi:uncharacterized protein with GYD domain
MPTFVLLTKLGEAERRRPKLRASKGKKWIQAIHRRCPGVKFLCHYAMLGPYDFLDVYEAPDAEAAAKISLISMAEGAAAAESWTLIPYERFLKLAKQV